MRTQSRVMSCLYIHTCIAWHLGAFEEEIENLVQHFANLLDEGHMEWPVSFARCVHHYFSCPWEVYWTYINTYWPMRSSFVGVPLRSYQVPLCESRHWCHGFMASLVWIFWTLRVPLAHYTIWNRLQETFPCCMCFFDKKVPYSNFCTFLRKNKVLRFHHLDTHDFHPGTFVGHGSGLQSGPREHPNAGRISECRVRQMVATEKWKQMQERGTRKYKKNVQVGIYIVNL